MHMTSILAAIASLVITTSVLLAQVSKPPTKAGTGSNTKLTKHPTNVGTFLLVRDDKFCVPIPDEKPVKSKVPGGEGPGDEWISGAEQKPKPVEKASPAVQTIVEGITVRDALFELDNNFQHHTLASDGKAVIIADGNAGRIRRVALPEVREELVLNLKNPCVGLGTTLHGLAVGVQGINEVWQLDEASLKVKRQYPVASLVGLVAAPGSPYVFCTVRNAIGQVVVRVLDFAKGEDLGTIELRYVQTVFNPREMGGEWQRLIMSPDGKWLSASNRLFAVDGPAIKFVSRFQNSEERGFSPDSAYYIIGAAYYKLGEELGRASFTADSESGRTQIDPYKRVVLFHKGLVADPATDQSIEALYLVNRSSNRPLILPGGGKAWLPSSKPALIEWPDFKRKNDPK